MKRLIPLLLILLPCLGFGQRLVWQQYLKKGGDNRSVKWIQTSDSGHLIIGFSTPPDTASRLFYIKLEKNYNVSWQKVVKHPYTQKFALDLAETPEHDYILAGCEGAPWLIKIKGSNGDSIWTKKFIGWKSVYFRKIISLSDSTYLLYCAPDITGMDNLGIFGVSAKGDSLWNVNITPANFLALQDTFLAVGGSYIKKYTNKGKIISTKNLTLNFGIENIYPLKEGGYLLSGLKGLAKLDYKLDTIWSRTYSVSSGNPYENYDLRETGDSGFAIIQSYGSFPYSSILLQKVDKNGKVQYWNTLMYGVEPRGFELHCDSSFVVLFDYIDASGNFANVLMAKLSGFPHIFGPCIPYTAIEESSNPFTLVTVYPNPVTDIVFLKTSNPENFKVTVSNSLGTQVAQVSGYPKDGLSLSNQSKGLYIFQIEDKLTNAKYQYKVMKL